MIASIKKNSFLVALTVSAIVLTFYSAAWAERLMSFIGDSYMINITIDNDAAQAFLDDEINPNLPQTEQLLSIGVGMVVLHNRSNLRDENGDVIGNGKDIVAILLLLVSDPAAPPPGFSTLIIESFTNNKDLIEYSAEKGIGEEDRKASEVKVTHEVEVKEDRRKMKGKFDISNIKGKIMFGTQFIAPEPYYDPLLMDVDDIVKEIPFRLRFASDPQRMFALSILRTIYELPVEETSFNLHIDIDESSMANQIFSGVDQKDVTRLRFVHQIQIADELIE